MFKVEISRADGERIVKCVISNVHNKITLLKKWANSCADEARANAAAKGGRRYWSELASLIRVKSVSDNTAEISADHVGADIKQYGGVIKPVSKQALTIPIAPEAKGKTAYECNTSAHPLFRLPKTRLLGYAEEDGSFKPLFVLAKKAVQHPDPWFPSDSRVYALLEREALFIRRKESEQWNSR